MRFQVWGKLIVWQSEFVRLVTSNMKLETVIDIQGIEIQLLRKSIKTLRLGVYPPDGRVRVSVPVGVSDEQVRLFVLDRVGWIKKQQAYFLSRVYPPVLQMVTGESHYLFGQCYQLEVIERHGRHEIVIQDATILQLYVHSTTTIANRLRVLTEWYRSQLKLRIPVILAHWQPIIGVLVTGWGVKNMKTRWGSCNRSKKRIWLNLQLAKKPQECLEYVVVHELVHLLERYHNKRFYGLLERFFPGWRRCRDLLK